MKSSSRALGQRFTGFAADNFHSVASPAVFERIVFRYGLAVLSVAIALSLKLILLHFNFSYPLSTSFLLAIAITFWYAGTGPGIFSVLLSFVAFAFFVLPYQVDYRIALPDGSTKPVYVSGVTASHIQYFFYFALLALLMSWFSSSRRRAEQSLSQARRELETKVEERTAKLSRTNEELQTEIIERKSAEGKLQRSKAFLSEGQRISHTGSWSWIVSSGKVTWSEEHFRIFGFDPEKTEPSFQLFMETVHPEDRSFIERNLEKAVREKSGFDMEFRIALTDGSIKHVQGVGRPVVEESGEVDRYIGRG
jgi:PAS domain-containing protein